MSACYLNFNEPCLAKKFQTYNFSVFVGVAEVQPKVLIIGSGGRCGRGAAYILERVGLPRSE